MSVKQHVEQWGQLAPREEAVAKAPKKESIVNQAGTRHHTTVADWKTTARRRKGEANSVGRVHAGTPHKLISTRTNEMARKIRPVQPVWQACPG